MNNETTKTTESKLREAFRAMKSPRALAIREAYYTAVEGLAALAEQLERADAIGGEQTGHALLQEHCIACEAIDAMKKSLIGRIL